jgi:predicted outer membrane protein
MKKAMAVGTVVLGLAAAPVFAAQETTRPHKAPETMDHKSGMDDQEWVMKVAQGGMAEVELGKLATEKAASDEVKKFGQRMVDDHSKANEELKTLAQNKKITLPTDIDAKHKAERDRLASYRAPRSTVRTSRRWSPATATWRGWFAWNRRQARIPT